MTLIADGTDFKAPSLSSPNEVRFSDLGLKSKAAITAFQENYLAQWITSGRLECSKNGIRILFPHLHLPKTKEWDEIRLRNFENVLSGLIRNDSDNAIQYREIVTRSLSESQAKDWAKELNQLELKLKALPYEVATSKTAPAAYSMLVAFAPREFKLPDEVRLSESDSETKGRS